MRDSWLRSVDLQPPEEREHYYPVGSTVLICPPLLYASSNYHGAKGPAYVGKVVGHDQGHDTGGHEKKVAYP